MRAFLLALVLATGGLVLVPSANAEPCEVPGCQVGPAALCLVKTSGEVVKGTAEKQDLWDCFTAPT